MPISSKSFETVIFLSELKTQCDLVKRYGARLRDAASGWQVKTFGNHENDRVAPIDIVAWCTVCLSSMGVIQRILFAGKRSSKKVINRCDSLRQLLNITNLPVLTSVAVRNAWEHLDERLDGVLHNYQGGSILEIHVYEKLPQPGTIILKRFDPVNLIIHFGNDSIPLLPSLEEIGLLETKINDAFQVLNTKDVRLWP